MFADVKATFKGALSSRLIITVLASIANAIIPDHDADAFKLNYKPILLGDYIIV
jgi:hypothetical protein